MVWIYLGIGAGVLAGLIVLMGLIGRSLPRGHVVQRSLRSKRSRETVWQTITDFASVPSWHPGVKAVERLADRNGHEVWRETYKGNHTLTLETVEACPPQRLVRSIADDKAPFTGCWEFELAAEGEGCHLTITERGDIASPFIRFLFRMFMNPALNLERYLKALAGNLGEPAVVEAAR